DDLEVLVAVDDLGGERRHVLVNTTAGRSMSRGSVRFLLSHYGYGRGYYSKAGARRSPLNLVTTHFDLSRNANRRRSDRKRSAEVLAAKTSEVRKTPSMPAFPRNPKKEKVATPQEERIFTPLTRKVRLGPIRVAVLMAIVQTPHRFRAKRPLW